MSTWASEAPVGRLRVKGVNKGNHSTLVFIACGMSVIGGFLSENLVWLIYNDETQWQVLTKTTFLLDGTWESLDKNDDPFTQAITSPVLLASIFFSNVIFHQRPRRPWIIYLPLPKGNAVLNHCLWFRFLYTSIWHTHTQMSVRCREYRCNKQKAIYMYIFVAIFFQFRIYTGTSIHFRGRWMFLWKRRNFWERKGFAPCICVRLEPTKPGSGMLYHLSCRGQAFSTPYFFIMALTI